MKHKKDIQARLILHRKELERLESENPLFAKLEYDIASSIQAFNFWQYSMEKQKIEQQIKVLQWILI